MSYEFIVSEEKGEKLYKLITIRIPQREGMKIVSKEDFNGKIHFCIYLGMLGPSTSEFTTKELKYKSKDEGIAKEDFELFVEGIIARLPEGTLVSLNDLSEYQTVKEQLKQGLNKKIMKVASVEG